MTIQSNDMTTLITEFLGEVEGCTQCGAVYLKYRMHRVSHVWRDPTGHSRNTFLYYCPKDAPPYDVHTTTSGYDRYYRSNPFAEMTQKGTVWTSLRHSR